MRDFLTAQEIVILKEAHHAAFARKNADRIKSILLLNEGFTYKEVARMLLLDGTTIRRYEREFKKGGVDELVEANYQGSESYLSIQDQESLTAYLKDHTHHTVKEIIGYVLNTYHQGYSIEGMTHLLHRLGFVYKKTKIIPGKLDPVKQVAFKEQYQNLKNSLGSEDKIYFVDASHPAHNNLPSYGWIYKGSERWIKTNTGRKRLNLNGALNLENLDITILSEDTINSEAMIRLLTTLEQKQPEGLIFCILDNARYNHSKKIKQFLKHHQRVQLIYLPPYSPNLNIIERLWLFFHRKQLQDHYYQTFDEFKSAAINFFDNIKTYKPELRSLLTDSFQTIPT